MVSIRDSTSKLIAGALFLALAMPALCSSVSGQARAMQLDSIDKSDAEPLADAITPGEQQLEVERQQSIEQLENTVSDAEAVRKALASLEQDLAGLREEQSGLTEALQDATAKRAILDRKISEGEERLTALSQREATVRKSLVDRRSVLAEVLASLQRIGRDPPPALLISPNDALSSVRSAILLGAVVPEIREETEALAHDLEELALLSNSIADERAAMTKALDENDKESERLSSLLSEKVELQLESERRLEIERQRAASLTEKSAELEQAVAALGAEIARQREAAMAARKAEHERKLRIAEQMERAQELAQSRLPEKNRIAPAYAFSALKGTLTYPVMGEPVLDFGGDNDSANTFSGDLLVTKPGTVVRAPVDGWVVYADEFRSYGPTLIIDTGDKYHMVLAGMERISVSQGQFVLAGEPVATMGNKRMAAAAALALATDSSTLYIEIRKDGKPVNPRQWWKDATSSGRVRDDT